MSDELLKIALIERLIRLGATDIPGTPRMLMKERSPEELAALQQNVAGFFNRIKDPLKEKATQLASKLPGEKIPQAAGWAMREMIDHPESIPLKAVPVPGISLAYVAAKKSLEKGIDKVFPLKTAAEKHPLAAKADAANKQYNKDSTAEMWANKGKSIGTLLGGLAGTGGGLALEHAATGSRGGPPVWGALLGGLSGGLLGSAVGGKFDDPHKAEATKQQLNSSQRDFVEAQLEAARAGAFPLKTPTQRAKTDDRLFDAVMAAEGLADDKQHRINKGQILGSLAGIGGGAWLGAHGGAALARALPQEHPKANIALQLLLPRIGAGLGVTAGSLTGQHAGRLLGKALTPTEDFQEGAALRVKAHELEGLRRGVEKLGGVKFDGVKKFLTTAPGPWGQHVLGGMAVGGLLGGATGYGVGALDDALLKHEYGAHPDAYMSANGTVSPTARGVSGALGGALLGGLLSSASYSEPALKAVGRVAGTHGGSVIVNPGGIAQQMGRVVGDLAAPAAGLLKSAESMPESAYSAGTSYGRFPMASSAPPFQKKPVEVFQSQVGHLKKAGFGPTPFQAATAAKQVGKLNGPSLGAKGPSIRQIAKPKGLGTDMVPVAATTKPTGSV